MDKIQELTSKLYAEGVQKGKGEAEKIIADANKQKEAILNEAKAKAEEIRTQAEKEATELKKHTQAELKLYANQSSEALKTEITNLITDKIATSSITSALEDKEFIQKLIVEMVQNWAKTENLTIGVENAEALTSYIASNSKKLLDEGLTIETVNGIKSGFTVSPEDGSYVVKFGEEEFIAYFKEFLRPQIQQLLF